jgi:hypothetical protein
MVFTIEVASLPQRVHFYCTQQLRADPHGKKKSQKYTWPPPPDPHG